MTFDFQFSTQLKEFYDEWWSEQTVENGFRQMAGGVDNYKKYQVKGKGNK